MEGYSFPILKITLIQEEISKGLDFRFKLNWNKIWISKPF